MTLSLSIATMAYFLKKFTLWSYDYDTFQPKIGQCGSVLTSNVLIFVFSMYFQPFFSKIPAIVSLDSRWHFMKKLQLTLVILSCVRCMIMHYKYKGVIKSRLITLHSILRKNLTYLLSWKLEFHSKLFLLN